MKQVVSVLGKTRVQEKINEILKDETNLTIVLLKDWRKIYDEIIFKYFDYKKNCRGARLVLDMLIETAKELNIPPTEEEEHMMEIEDENGYVDENIYDYRERTVSRELILDAVYGKIDVDDFIRLNNILNRYW